MKKNPHMHLRAIDPPGTSDRHWRCMDCGMCGLYDNVIARRCEFVHKPCKHCGQAPECALDCRGVALALAGADVYVVGQVPVDGKKFQ